MIARILLFVKHRLPWLWGLIDWLNARLFRMLHKKSMAKEVDRAFLEFRLNGLQYRSLATGDLPALVKLLNAQGQERLRYFQPHGFDLESLTKMHRNPAFLMFGVFRDNILVGYFFLRCFWNRKCFVGRLIDHAHEGQGIGRVMNQIMYHIAWRSGFRCMTTISRDNQFIMRAHANNPHARVLGPLANGYLLVEFIPQATSEQREALGR